MKQHSGGIMAFLNLNTQKKAAASATESSQESISQLDVHDLVRNERNFYGIRDIEELASMIAASGIVEPLTVTPIGDGKYRIIAGERRASATLLRLERGDLIDPKLPCIVKTFAASGTLDANDMEMLYLIASNRGQRQTRTALEKLREIEELEPIAKKIFKDEQIQGTFRQYFAKEILSISPAQLQRLKALKDLIPDAQRALEMEILSDTAAMELSLHSDEEQMAYLNTILEDGIKPRVRDIKEFFGAQEDIDPTDDEPDDNEIAVVPPSSSAFGGNREPAAPADADEIDDTNAEEEAWENSDEPEEDPEVEPSGEEPRPSSPAPEARCAERRASQAPPVRANATINLDVPIPKDMSGEQMEREADTWMETILKDSIKVAEGKRDEAREAGETRIAALWDSRRAKAVLVLETVRE